MNVLLKRRQLILATLVVALGAAVFVNWYYTSDSKLQPDETTQSQHVQNLGEAQYVNAGTQSQSAFTEMKFERQKQRDTALDNLNKSLKAAKQGSDEATEITKAINDLTASAKAETDVEAVIKTKLKCDSFVTITDGKAQVIVAKGFLNEKTSLQIMELVISNTKIPAENITMSEG